jgi:hypothetical protein
MLIDPRSGLRFLPAGSKTNMPHTSELLSSEAMKNLISNLRGLATNRKSHRALCRRARWTDVVRAVDAAFAVFAEWFTDSFLLTDDYNRARTKTPHQIDLLRGPASNRFGFA